MKIYEQKISVNYVSPTRQARFSLVTTIENGGEMSAKAVVDYLEEGGYWDTMTFDNFIEAQRFYDDYCNGVGRFRNLKD
jgi:hypothetical protein